MSGLPRSILALVLLSAGALSCSAEAQDLTGTFLGGGDPPVALELEAVSSTGWQALLRIPGLGVHRASGDFFIDDEGDPVAEGILDGGVGDIEWGYDREEGIYTLVMTPWDPSGVPRLDRAGVWVLERTDSEEGLAGDLWGASGGLWEQSDDPRGGNEQVGSRGNLDPRLVGTWATQVVMNTPGGGIATQMRMAFHADGTMVDLGSRSMGSFPDAGIDVGGGGGETANWRTNGDVLEVSQHGTPWVPLARYRLSANSLLFTFTDGSTQLWERTR